MWARTHGVKLDEEAETDTGNPDGPDKAAFRARYGSGKVIRR